jgi:hypothetical protein
MSGNKLIVTGYRAIADHRSPSGWRNQPYARLVSAIEDITETEVLWGGVLNWVEADPEGRHGAGWLGPHGLIIRDDEALARIENLRRQIQVAGATIATAEHGHRTPVWDDQAGEWRDEIAPPSEAEIQAGLEAMDLLPSLRTALEEATHLQIDGSQHAAALAEYRDRQQTKRQAAAATGDTAAMPPAIADLIACLRGQGSVLLAVNGELAWQKQWGPRYSAGKHSSMLRPYWAQLAALSAAHSQADVRDWFI